MEIVLATNFDDALVDAVHDLPVSTFFGGFPVSLTGAGRPPFILPSVSSERFREHLEVIHGAGKVFYATLNSNDLGLKEYDPEFLPAFRAEVDRLLGLGVDGLILALPVLVEAVRELHPDVPISLSTFARVRTVNQVGYFRRLGVRTVIVEEGNRDFRLLRGLVRSGFEVEVLVNQTCIRDCPYRGHHLNTSSLCSQPGGEKLWFEYPLLECGSEVLRDPTRLISSIWVRPEDLKVYEEVGVQRFKISGRNRSTEWLLRAARAYADRTWKGDLLDLLSLVQVKGPRKALEELDQEGRSPELVRPWLAAFDRMREVEIDNQAFPPDFMRRVAETDCERVACSACGYCASVAEKVLRIGGLPPSQYQPPAQLPTAARFLPLFGLSPKPPVAPERPRPLSPTA
jgi:collagenase-like PrtC family protease